MEQTRQSTGAPETARAAGRGGLALSFAKVYFIAQGLLQQILLPRVLGLDGYGALASVLSAAGIAYNPMVTASIQGVSRAVARVSPDEQPSVVRRVLSVHAVLAAVAALMFALAAPAVAAFMRAPHIAETLRGASLVLLFYGLYSPLIGVLNGTRRFPFQAGFDIVAATLRTIALIACGAVGARSGHGVEGSVAGFVSVTAILLMAALWVVGTGKKGASGPAATEHISYLAPLFAAQVLLNLLLQADLTLLRRFAGDAAAIAHLPSTVADPLVGAYRAIQLYAFLPYQLLVSVTFILFPMLASADRQGDRAAVALYVSTGVRIACLVSGALVSVTSGLSGPMLRLVYPGEVAALGSHAMQILTIGFGSFAILGVLTAVLASLGKERGAALLTGAAFALVVTLCFVWASGSALDESLLVRTALSTSTGLLLATVCAGLLVRRVAGAVVPFGTVLRTALALAAAITAGRLLPEGGRVWTLVCVAIVGLVYVVLLVGTRELGRSDWNVVRAVASRGK